MSYIRFLIFLIFIFFSGNVFSQELIIPIKKYIPLSKTIDNSLPGSSKIIITKKDIEKYKNTQIQDIIEFESGIKSRSIYGSNSSGSKTTIDIRGMGAQAKSNILILINGQRLNNIDMSEIDFPSIPIESIDIIEIIKGNAASVLYGEGAIGGVINIITKPAISEKRVNEVILKSGTHNYKEFNWKYIENFGRYKFNTYFNNTETDGYRDHNEQKQTNLTSELRYSSKKNDHFIQIGINDQNMNTPGDRSQNEIYSDRKGTDTLNDYIKSDGAHMLYGSNYIINDSIKLIFDASLRLKDSYSDLQSTSFPSYSETFLRNYQLTPRINQTTNFYKKELNSVYGLDIQYADYYSHRKKNQLAIPLHVYDAWQTSHAIYTHQSINLTEFTTLGGGLRYQKNKIAIGDHLETAAPDYAGWQTEHQSYLNQETNYAYNIGIEYELGNKNTIYSRLGTGFRYANIDDRIGGSGGNSLDLNTQETKDYEIGTKFISDNFFYNLSAYLIEGENEIAYDTDAFENINMNSTKRFGLELQTKNKISNQINLINNLTFAKAKYTSGDQGTYATDFNNKDVPLVPQYSYDGSVEWEISDSTKFITKIKYQDEMRMESDDENFQPKIPSYVIAGISIYNKFDKFFTNLSINNLFDETYYNYAVSSSSTLGTYNAYPLPGREIILSIGVDF